MRDRILPTLRAHCHPCLGVCVLGQVTCRMGTDRDCGRGRDSLLAETDRDCGRSLETALKLGASSLYDERSESRDERGEHRDERRESLYGT